MKRPTSVTVFGILNIVFAALGILGVLGSLMVFTVLVTSSNNPVVQVIHDNPAYAAWMKIGGVLGLIVSGGLLAAGIGLLLLRPWGRILSIAYSIYSFVMVPIGLVMISFFCCSPCWRGRMKDKDRKPQARLAELLAGCSGVVAG